MPTIFDPNGLLGKAESKILGENETTGKKALALAILGSVTAITFKKVSKIIDDKL